MSRSGPCETIDGADGSWVPEDAPAFPDAPREVQASTCIVRWTSSTNAAPDKKALDDAMGFGAGVAPACGQGAAPAVGEVAVAMQPPIVILGGSVGCDVCGILRGGTVWVVLPPDGERRLVAPLTNGGQSTFTIKPSSSPALSIPLPPPPVGTQYKDGVVKIL